MSSDERARHGHAAGSLARLRERARLAARARALRLAGTMTLLSVTLAVLISPWFLLLTAFVGVNQWLYVLFGACPASLVLGRLFDLRSVVYPRGQASS